jgi:hypothetical protein
MQASAHKVVHHVITESINYAGHYSMAARRKLMMRTSLPRREILVLPGLLCLLLVQFESQNGLTALVPN